MNRNRITKEIKDELDILFPYKRVVNSETAVNVAEEWINTISNEIFNTKWIPQATPEYVEAGMTDGVILTPNLKIEVGKLLIDIERIIKE